MIRNLYEKYLFECSHNSLLRDINFTMFQEIVNNKLSNMYYIRIDDRENEQGIFYYSRWKKDNIQICDVPVYGYYASSKKIMSKLFCKWQRKY